MPEWARDELQAALPEGWRIHWVEDFSDGSGDGTAGEGVEVLDAVQGARVYLGFGVSPEVLRAGSDSLLWVHSAAAGVGGSLHPEMRASEVRFTNSAGVHGPPMAETAIGMLLYFFRGFDLAAAGQQVGRWNRERFDAADTPVRELGEATVGILGCGGVGGEVARRLRALGSRVIALRRTALPSGWPPSPAGLPIDPAGVEWLEGPEAVDRLVAEVDALVLTAPETPQTRGILSAERIRAMRRGAVLVNLARGGLLSEPALIEALRSGALRGAGLDVFATEPLPEGHPFWTLPNVLITPHVSAVSRGFWRREMDLILENFRRILEDPSAPLLNEVNRREGY